MTDRPIASRNPKYFKKLYAANQDPWNFASSNYENAKYQATLAVLGKRNFESAFEIGCSIGILTRMLAERTQSLLAVDVVKSVLAAAKENCIACKHVRFENLRVPHAWPAEQKFDLIICSEVLYFLSPKDITRVAELAYESLFPDGLILLVNYTGQIDEPCNGDDAAEIFLKSRHCDLAVQKQIRREKFRIDVLAKRTNTI